MPKKNGFDVLAWVRTQPGLKRVPFIVVTASACRDDIERAFELGANGYLVKPSDLEKLVDMIRCLREWLEINQFPPSHAVHMMAERERA
jgi:CheY-like chemotaxis protein